MSFLGRTDRNGGETRTPGSAVGGIALVRLGSTGVPLTNRVMLIDSS
jgi:hypothetical protein